MTHLEDLNRIEIRHLRDTVNMFENQITHLTKLLKTIREENETLKAKNELYLRQQKQEYKESKA